MLKHGSPKLVAREQIMFPKILFICVCAKICLVTYTDCKMEGFILGGDYASIEQYPYQVFLDIQGKEPCVCGGSILNQIIILTAAHCLNDLTKEHSTVTLMYGSENLNTMKHKHIKAYMMHEDFNYASMYADIALAQVKHPLKLGQFIKKVAIMEEPQNKKVGVIAGWGDSYVGARSNLLKHTKQEIQSAKVCERIATPQGSFCAGPVSDVPGNPAVGDSGGAFVVSNYIQIGIVSYKVHDYTIAAYTNVTYYYSWIRRNSGYLYCRTR